MANKDAVLTQEQIDIAHPPKEHFDGDPRATRSKQVTRYDLIPPVALELLAERLKLGADRHGANNWKHGGNEFEQATISHLMGHLKSYMENPNREDVSAIICNAAFLCHFQNKRDGENNNETDTDSMRQSGEQS